MITAKNGWQGKTPKVECFSRGDQTHFIYFTERQQQQLFFFRNNKNDSLRMEKQVLEKFIKNIFCTRDNSDNNNKSRAQIVYCFQGNGKRQEEQESRKKFRS
jgi:hypothetical protein